MLWRAGRAVSKVDSHSRKQTCVISKLLEWGLILEKELSAVYLAEELNIKCVSTLLHFSVIAMQDGEGGVSQVLLTGKLWTYAVSWLC